MATSAVKTEVDDTDHASEEHQISNNPVSLSSIQSPAVCAASTTQLQSNQPNPQTLHVLLSLPCFTVLEAESTGTSNYN